MLYRSIKASNDLTDCVQSAILLLRANTLARPPHDPTTRQPDEENTVTAPPAPCTPADTPVVPTPYARTLLARLTGQSGAGPSVTVTMEQSTSPAATVFLTISSDGVNAPVEKFLGVQKGHATARLLAIRKELHGSTLERFDEPTPEPPPEPAPPATRKPATGKTTPATGKPATGKTAPAAPTAPIRARDQVTVIAEQGRYAALMIVGPSSRYEVVKDYGLPTVTTLWDITATRAWQPQQRAAREKLAEVFAADPSPRGTATVPASPEPVALSEPVVPLAAPEPVVPVAPSEPAPTPAPVPPPTPARKPGRPKKEKPKEVEPDDDGPAL